MTKPAAYRVRDAARKLAVSEATVYRRIADGSINAIRLGSIQLVPIGEIERLLSGRQVA